MEGWNAKTEEELTALIKDWLKSTGRNQAELGRSLNSASSRMPALIELLKSEYKLGGMPNIASRLCSIEKSWDEPNKSSPEEQIGSDPFGQLDLILQELRDKSDRASN